MGNADRRTIYVMAFEDCSYWNFFPFAPGIDIGAECRRVMDEDFEHVYGIVANDPLARFNPRYWQAFKNMLRKEPVWVSIHTDDPDEDDGTPAPEWCYAPINEIPSDLADRISRFFDARDALISTVGGTTPERVRAMVDALPPNPYDPDWIEQDIFNRWYTHDVVFGDIERKGLLSPGLAELRDALKKP